MAGALWGPRRLMSAAPRTYVTNDLSTPSWILVQYLHSIPYNYYNDLSEWLLWTASFHVTKVGGSLQVLKTGQHGQHTMLLKRCLFFFSVLL
jgi:hypothetical protein